MYKTKREEAMVEFLLSKMWRDTYHRELGERDELSARNEADYAKENARKELAEYMEMLDSYGDW